MLREGRKHDFKDAERLVRRLIAKELILSFVPGGEQRIWRNLSRMKLQLVRDRVRLRSQIECLLEEMRIKLSVVVTDLLGSSGMRMLHALAQGETDAKRLALLGDERLKCSEEQLIEALTGRTHPVHAQMLMLQLERLRLLDEQITKLNSLLRAGHDPTSGRCDQASGSARTGHRFSTTGDRGSGSDSRHLLLRGGVHFLGGDLSRQRRKR